MFLANLSKREKSLMYAVAGVIFLSLLYNFVFKTLLAEWKQLDYEISDKEITLRRNLRYIQQKNSVKNIYLKYNKYVQQKDSEVSNEEEMAALLNEVEKIAQENSVHITNIKPIPTKKLLFYKKYSLEMDCRATMEKYIKFIYSLYQSVQLIRAEKVKVASQGKNTSLLKIHMLITKVSIAN